MKRDLPLDGLIVVDMSQFLAGPSAALRLADLGARVIKLERPGTGDGCRRLYLSGLKWNDESALFQTINRNKESFVADLKNPDDRRTARRLIEKADVVIQSFRPGVAKRLELDWDNLRDRNKGLVHASITGFGPNGPWAHDPGQDLLLQAVSGIAWLSGNASDPPVPMGLSIVDMATGAQLVQGILSLLVRRGVTGQGGKVEVSMLEAAMDLQFEFFSTYLNGGKSLPQRSESHSGNAYAGPPYGVFAASDGYIAIAMADIPELGRTIGCVGLDQFVDAQRWFELRDSIKAILAEHLSSRPVIEWMKLLESGGFWAAPVYNWDELMEQEGFAALDLLQETVFHAGALYRTTRCPIRIDGEVLKSSTPAPVLGNDTRRIGEEFGL